MTHEYTLLVGGTVIAGAGLPAVTALAWAEGTIIALGSDDDVRTISRGDSHLVDLQGAYVVALGPDGATTIPEPGPGSDAVPGARLDVAPGATLEVGGPADLAVLELDPRRPPAGGMAAGSIRTLALVRGGHVVAGRLPGLEGHDQHGGHGVRNDPGVKADPGAGPTADVPPRDPGGRPGT